MEFEFSKHAIIQLKRRGISRDVATKVILHADSSFSQNESITVYSKLVEEESKSYLYRVFVNVSKNPPLIITAYKTSKIEKYGY